MSYQSESTRENNIKSLCEFVKTDYFNIEERTTMFIEYAYLWIPDNINEYTIMFDKDILKSIILVCIGIRFFSLKFITTQHFNLNDIRELYRFWVTKYPEFIPMNPRSSLNTSTQLVVCGFKEFYIDESLSEWLIDQNTNYVYFIYSKFINNRSILQKLSDEQIINNIDRIEESNFPPKLYDSIIENDLSHFYKYIPEKFRNDKVTISLCCKNLKLIGTLKNPSEELLKQILDSDPSALKNINSKYLTDKLVLHTIKKHPSHSKYLKSKESKLASVKINCKSIQWIENVTKKMEFQAYISSKTSIRYINKEHHEWIYEKFNKLFSPKQKTLKRKGDPIDDGIPYKKSK